MVGRHHENGLIIPHRNADAVWTAEKGEMRNRSVVGIPQQPRREASTGFDEELKSVLSCLAPRGHDERM